MSIKDFPPITKLVDEGIQREVESEIRSWNKRDGLERYPLSPSQIGKCSLKLARDIAHYHGLADYPKGDRTSRLHRIFKRGDTLELALVEDFAKWTSLKMQLRQQRVHLFDVEWDDKLVAIEGNIDGMVLDESTGSRILIDFKSKGAYYSAGFGDSISEFFQGLVQTGLVENMGNDCYFITDVVALYKLLPQDDFVVDYLLQLNAYAFSDWFKRTPVDGVSLYYENKNTCANYELRWVPDKKLFDYAKEKFQWIFETTMQEGPEAVPKDYNFGSARCRLCEYNQNCWGDDPGYGQKKVDRVTGMGSEHDQALEAYTKFKNGISQEKIKDKAENEILLVMEQKGLTHITMPDGLTYERRFLKSPKPHYELRLVK
jgi:hypothetical protein